jgi:chromate transporter
LSNLGDMSATLQAVSLQTVLWGPVGINASQWWALLWHFAALSLLAVGGAITTVSDMQRFVVQEQRWLTDLQFSAGVALAQAAPGPNVLFVAVIGYQVGGLAGVVATMAGTLLPSTTLALAASRWGHRPQQARLMTIFTTGMAPITLGLLLATSWVLLKPVGNSWPAALLVATTLVVMLRTERSPLWLIGLGAAVGAAGWV